MSERKDTYTVKYNNLISNKVIIVQQNEPTPSYMLDVTFVNYNKGGGSTTVQVESGTTIPSSLIPDITPPEGTRFSAWTQSGVTRELASFKINQSMTLTCNFVGTDIYYVKFSTMVTTGSVFSPEGTYSETQVSFQSRTLWKNDQPVTGLGNAPINLSYNIKYAYWEGGVSKGDRTDTGTIYSFAGSSDKYRLTSYNSGSKDGKDFIDITGSGTITVNGYKNELRIKPFVG